LFRLNPPATFSRVDAELTMGHTLCDPLPIWPIGELTHDTRDPRLTSYDHCLLSELAAQQPTRCCV